MRKLQLEKHDYQAAVLLFSTFCGTAMGFVASIVNTRFLGPEDYGDVRYVQNIIQLISWTLLFGYFFSGSRLLAISTNEKKSRELRGTMIVILAICSLLLILSTMVVSLFHNGIITHLMLVSLPVCIYPLLLNYINTTLQGDNFIGRICIARLLPPILYVIIAYFVYSEFRVSSSLMVLLQWGIYSAVLLCIVLSTRPSFRGVAHCFVELNNENRQYGIQLYYGSLAMVATNYIAGVMLGIFNDDNSNVAYYTLALNLTTPLSYLPGVVGTAFFKKFANLSCIPKIVLKTTVLITLLTCVVFVVLAKPVVHFFYPDEYSCVATYASWMSVGFCVHGIGDMLNRYLGSHGQGCGIRNASFFCGAVKIVGFTLLVWLFNIEGALVTTVLSSIVYSGSIVFYYCRFVKG